MVTRETKDTRKHREPLGVNARRMRREPTEAELKFWYQVRNRRLDGMKFRRQVPIGRYIADFLCTEHSIIVEIDGGQHADAVEQDAARDAFLAHEGYRVLRFWNADVSTNMDGVADAILAAVRGARPPHPALSR